MDLESVRFQNIRKESKDFNLKFNIILLGNCCVGKSCICMKQTINTFTNDYIATLGYQNFINDIKIRDIKMKLYLYDTSGKESNDSTIKSLIKNITLAIIVYAIDE